MRLALIRLLRDRRGSAAVEFAIVLPILISLLLGVFEFGRLFWIWSTVQQATEEAGRYAMLNPTATDTALSDFLKARVPGINPASINVTFAPETDGSINYTVVVAQFHFEFLNLFPINAIDLQGRSRVPRVS